MMTKMRYLPLATLSLTAVIAATAITPVAIAVPSEVKLEVAQNCYLPNWACWNPEGNPESNVPVSQVAPFEIAQGGTISFEDNDSKAPTDVVWKGAAPTCTGVVQAPPTQTGWSGTCTFADAGDYEFESAGLFDDGASNYTKYTVIVEIPGAPLANTATASAVNETEATLRGTVDPEGKETKYLFEWGKDSTGYEHTTPEVVLGIQDTSSHEVSALLAGLEPATTYHYRVLARNGAGTTDGEDHTFTTSSPPGPPSASTGQAGGLGETAATLNGTVDPDGQMTSYLFQWGTSESYGHSTSEAQAGSDHSSHTETADLSELTAGTVYHFRIVAKNQTETVMGSEVTFTTASPPSPNTPSPISSPIGGSPLATTSTTPPTSSPGSQVVPASTRGTVKTTKPLTQAQKLASALKQCERQPKKKRARCEAKARKLYAPKHKSHKR